MNPNNKKSDRKTILVVEDDTASFLLIKEILIPLDPILYHVRDGKEAIEYVKTNPDIYLVLMDIKLPDMNGYETTREIIKINPCLPIIAQTAYALEADRQRAIDSGCIEYISKPLNANKFYELVKSYLLKEDTSIAGH